MSFLELRAYVTRLRGDGYQVKKYLVELYSKLSFPLVNLIMVLVAIPFALARRAAAGAPRRRAGHRDRGGLLVVHYVALAFARADLLPAALAAWTANIIFLGLGTSLFLRART